MLVCCLVTLSRAEELPFSDNFFNIRRRTRNLRQIKKVYDTNFLSYKLFTTLYS